MYECKSCGWSGSEARMVKTAAGWKYSICPECSNGDLKFNEKLFDEVVDRVKDIRGTCKIYVTYKGRLYEVDKNFNPPIVSERFGSKRLNGEKCNGEA